MTTINVSSSTQRIVVGPNKSVKIVNGEVTRPEVDVVSGGPVGPPGIPIKGDKGDPGIQGPPGPSGGETYVHTQSLPSDHWVIPHNLGRYPSVEIIDSAGSLVVGSVRYVDINLVEASFVYPFSGKAFLN